MTMKLVATTTVGAGGATNITFSGIPQTASDLYVILNARSTASGQTNVGLQFNGSTTGYETRRFWGDSQGGYYETRYDNGYSDSQNYPTSTANTFSIAFWYVHNYRSSTTKRITAEAIVENAATNSMFSNYGGFWTGTSAISSLALTGDFAQNTVASLYTITSGSGGATV